MMFLYLDVSSQVKRRQSNNETTKINGKRNITFCGLSPKGKLINKLLWATYENAL